MSWPSPELNLTNPYKQLKKKKNNINNIKSILSIKILMKLNWIYLWSYKFQRRRLVCLDGVE